MQDVDGEQRSSLSLVALLGNVPFLSAVISFLIAQLSKFMLHYHKTGIWDKTRLWGSGGMPSSHTSFVTGLTMAGEQRVPHQKSNMSCQLEGHASAINMQSMQSPLLLAVCLVEGSGSTAFAICFVVTAITAYDATGVRQHAGAMAEEDLRLCMRLPISSAATCVFRSAGLCLERNHDDIAARGVSYIDGLRQREGLTHPHNR